MTLNFVRYCAVARRALRRTVTLRVWVTSRPLRGDASPNTCQIKHCRKGTQPTLKYLLMVAIQYNSIGLTNTQYRCDYTRAHAGHVILLPARASPSVVFKQSKCKDVFFTSATSVHCRTLPGISFLLNLPE
jgi:hypothetical protein